MCVCVCESVCVSVCMRVGVSVTNKHDFLEQFQVPSKTAPKLESPRIPLSHGHMAPCSARTPHLTWFQ